MPNRNDPKSRELKSRDYKIIQCVAEGMTNQEVGEAVGTTEHVIKNYLREIYDKLGVWNRVELALWYEKRRWDETHNQDIG